MRRDVVRALLDLRHLGIGDDLQAALFELLTGEGGNFRILDRHDLRQQFDDGHVDAHRAVEAREFDADRAGAMTSSDFGNSSGFIASK